MQSTRNLQGQALAFSVPNAATVIGVSRSTLYELLATKHIRAFKVGRRTLIADSELRRFVAERMGAAA
jgi:excisionase family DNA binding protein